MADKIEIFNGSLIQHGYLNDRAYLMRLNLNDIEGTLASVAELVKDKGYGKVFARIPLDAWPVFKTAGYQKEAVIPGFYRGHADGLFVASYFTSRRQELPPPETMEQLLSIIDEKPPVTKTTANRALRPIVKCGPSDTAAMGTLYRQIFESYPFPICDPGYLEQVMAAGVLYYAVQSDGGIDALAAAEVDRENEVVEMTDFATLPKWRRAGLAGLLLRHMEKEVHKLGIKTAYTIARAASPGINRLFRSSAYRYAGLLINNTHISGSIQSMTVWYKTL